MRFYLVLILLAGGVFSGCAFKPDHVDRVGSPLPGLFATVETHYGRGAPAPDVTRVYVHLEADGKADKKLVLDGEYLEKTKVIWLNSHEVILCISDAYSYIDSFHNSVYFGAGKGRLIRVHLQEDCQP